MSQPRDSPQLSQLRDHSWGHWAAQTVLTRPHNEMNDSQIPTPQVKQSWFDTTRTLQIWFWLLTVVLGATSAWLSRFQMGPDGVSYLDIGDAFWRGQLHNLANPYWSPLYPLILGFFMKVVRPTIGWEFPLVRLVNCFIFLMTAVCFEFFLQVGLEELRPEGTRLAKSWYQALGYSIFLSTSLVLITATIVSPDMLVAAFMYLIAGLALRLYRDPENQRLAFGLGIALGLGYYAKTILFPVGIVFLAVLVVVRKFRAKHLLTAGITFLLLALPLVAAISRHKHRLTIGESGRWNYLVLFNHVNPFFPAGGIHEVKKIPNPLAIYDFTATIPGTYPVWYDPSYWNDGIKPTWNVSAVPFRFKQAFIVYVMLLLMPNLQLSLTVGFIAFAALGFSVPIRKPLILVLLPAAATLWAYSVFLVEFRYLGPFLCLSWIALFFGFVSNGRNPSKIVFAFMIVANLISILWMMASLPEANRRFYFSVPAAIELRLKGLRPSDEIALISREAGVVAGQGSFIPRLAKLRINSEVIDPDGFLKSSPNAQAEVLSKLERTGAKAALLFPDTIAPDSSWLPLDKSGYFYKPLALKGTNQENDKLK